MIEKIRDLTIPVSESDIIYIRKINEIVELVNKLLESQNEKE